MHLADLTDEDLMARYQLGSEEAFAILYRRHSPKVFGFIKRRIYQSELISEIFQEVFVKMHKSKHLYNRTFAFSARTESKITEREIENNHGRKGKVRL